jgi:hypothetical protein
MKNLIDYFTLNNKSGYKTSKKWLKKNNIILYNEIIQYSEHNNIESENFKELIFLYIHNISSIPKCKYCGKQLKFGRTINESYPVYCSIKCTNKSPEHKEKMIINRNYDKIKEKTEKTMLIKYGVKNIFEKKEYIQDCINKKYGDKIITKTDHFKNIMNKKYENKYIDLNIKKTEFIEYKCPKCQFITKHNYNRFNYRNKYNIDLCTNCFPIKMSSLEKEMETFLNDLNITFSKHNRKIITPYELDFYLPEYNIAIEMHGLYFHSEEFVNNSYHFNKFIECKNKNITLIQIFHDEWKYKKNIILNIIKNKLNIDIIKIYARKCVIKELNNDDYNKFLTYNHIQGKVTTNIKLGLFYNSELIQVMGFSNLRKPLGFKSSLNNVYELIRLSTKLGYNTIGGTSKLLKYFEIKYKPKQIISYSDNRYFDGNTYLVNGFNFIKYTQPNYHYIFKNKIERLNRFNFRKDILIKQGFDSSMTERMIMKINGYLRIYDAGNKKFIKNYFN